MNITIELTESEVAAVQKAVAAHIFTLAGGHTDDAATDTIDTLDDVLEKVRVAEAAIEEVEEARKDDELEWCSWHAPWGEPKSCLILADPNDQNGPGDDVLCIEHQTEAWREHEGERQGEQMREDA